LKKSESRAESGSRRVRCFPVVVAHSM
jgi:hypothetical protein